jgi:hypothetical protein
MANAQGYATKLALANFLYAWIKMEDVFYLENRFIALAN